MIFKELKLKDFRQFYGEQTLTFATDVKQRKVTVLHGFNGAGKTTLLNAFTWVLYGETSSDFEFPDRLENESAFTELEPGGVLTTWIRLTFDDRHKEYSATRALEVYKDEHGKRVVSRESKLSLGHFNEKGEYCESNNPQDLLSRMLPKALCPFFFFNGERIEHLTSESAYKKVEEGVKILLDLELFERSIRRLGGKLEDELRKEIADHAGHEGEMALNALHESQEIQRQILEKLNQTRKNIASYSEMKEDVIAQQREIQEIAPLMIARDEKDKQFENTKLQLKDLKAEICKVISRHGYLILAPQVLNDAEAVLDKAYQKGDIPSLIKRQFVDELLQAHQCICKRDLIEGSLPYEEVKGWRDRAKLSDLEAIATVTRAAIEPLRKRREDAIQDLNRFQLKRDELNQLLNRLEEEISELKYKLKNYEHSEDPRKLESLREKYESNLRHEFIKENDYKKELAEIEQVIDEQDQEISNLKRADGQGKLAQRRLEAVQHVKCALEAIRQIRYDELRKDLSQRLMEAWSKIAIKDYQAILNDRFIPSLTKRIGGEEEPVRGASTGEKQVLNLAFVASLVAKAKATYEQASQKPNSMFQGGLYPLVMDSAFGSLEDDYRRGVARGLPALAPQLVILVSETQWRKEVEEELKPYIGSEWILRCETSQNKSRTIQLREQEYEYVIQSPTEKTTLVEVEL